MEKKNLMVQAPHSTEYATEKLFPELVELSKNDLRQIVGGYVLSSESSEIEELTENQDHLIDWGDYGNDTMFDRQSMLPRGLKYRVPKIR